MRKFQHITFAISRTEYNLMRILLACVFPKKQPVVFTFTVRACVQNTESVRGPVLFIFIGRTCAPKRTHTQNSECARSRHAHHFTANPANQREGWKAMHDVRHSVGHLTTRRLHTRDVKCRDKEHRFCERPR